jgi:SAM-dependent methyltransferase
MNKTQYLSYNTEILKNKTVLDLACHTGESTKIIHSLGAKHVYGVEVRNELVNLARRGVRADNVEFFTADITDYNFMSSLIKDSNTITCFGVLYHLFDHFRFLSHILAENIEHVLIETEFGSETLNPEMFWGFEITDNKFHGYHKNLKIIPNGTPNLSWILQSAEIFGFKCDWVQCYGNSRTKQRNQITSEEYLSIAGPDWPTYSHLISDTTIPEFVEQELSQFLQVFTSKRMILRLYNTNLINSTPLRLQDIYRWPY